MPKSFRDLDVYQLARKLAIEKLDRINKINKMLLSSIVNRQSEKKQMQDAGYQMPDDRYRIKIN